jgi:hypothetical protein
MLVLNASDAAFCGRRVLVTGHTRFKGTSSWLRYENREWRWAYRELDCKGNLLPRDLAHPLVRADFSGVAL